MSANKAQKPTILYIDDEKINLENFREVFADDFSILTALSGDEGVEIFTNHRESDIAAVVTDQRMPGISGTETLAKILAIDPDPCRIILTAYSNFQELSEGVNKGQIYAWVQKPWEYLLLKPVLLRAVQSYQITKENKKLIETLSEKNDQLKKELRLREMAEKKKREAEIRMLAQSKLASLGEMATGVAHEINQPLTYIKILLEATRRDFQEDQFEPLVFFDEEIPEGLEQIGRISTIIDHMRTFGRESTTTMEDVALEKIINATLIPMRQRLIDKGINLQINFDDMEDTAIYCNPLRIEQVLVNLFTNSIDALADREKGKAITITAQKGKNSLLLLFTDNGCGMSDAVQEKVFEPFFTTKEVGKGTGIGLSISYGIITEHKGSITCDSTPQEGTTFTISLPLSSQS